MNTAKQQDRSWARAFATIAFAQGQTPSLSEVVELGR